MGGSTGVLFLCGPGSGDSSSANEPRTTTARPTTAESTSTTELVLGGPDAGLVSVGSGASALVEAEGLLFVTNRREGTVSVVDPEGRTLIADIETGLQPERPMTAAGLVWVANGGSGDLSVIDPRALEVVATIDVGLNPRTPTMIDDELWVASFVGGTMTVIDPTTFEVVESFELGPQRSGVSQPALGETKIWSTLFDEGMLVGVDPVRRQAIARVEVGRWPSPPIVAEGTFGPPMTTGDSLLSTRQPAQSRRPSKRVPARALPYSPRD
ncbi:MAG: hypothetical protein GY939_26825 [Actinomycetia bacterium]|nr:hypothetical protein [Actinomycetes bacterium]